MEFTKVESKMTWCKGRAFVYDEEGQVEYFYKFEDANLLPESPCIRSFCGGLREPSKCRPLDYVCKPKYLKVK